MVGGGGGWGVFWCRCVAEAFCAPTSSSSPLGFRDSLTLPARSAGWRNFANMPRVSPTGKMIISILSQVTQKCNGLLLAAYVFTPEKMGAVEAVCLQ